MTKHLIVGAGGIGQAVARELVSRGHDVIIASRSGRDAGIAGARSAQVDATDADAIARLASGADSIVNALNPAKYYTWERDWPPMAVALLDAAERTGAGLVTVSNLYLYGEVDAPMTESTVIAPAGVKGRVRAQMWADALAAHHAGRVRATELRASDYFGPGAGKGVSYANQYLIAPAAAGKTVRVVLGSPDVPHSWTYLDDIGRLAAALATDDRSWGRAWHVPSSEPRTQRQLAADATAAAGQQPAKVTMLPAIARLMARVSPTVRALDETAHQFDRPFVLDASDAERTFGITATPWGDAIATTVGTLLPTAMSRSTAAV